MNHYLIMIIVSFIWRASFTLICKASHSHDYFYHSLAITIDTAVFFYVLKTISEYSNEPYIIFACLVGALMGSLVTQYITINYIDKKIDKK